MTNKPNPVPPRQLLQLPPNCIDRTAEHIGTVIAIVGAAAAGKGTKPGWHAPLLPKCELQVFYRPFKFTKFSPFVVGIEVKLGKSVALR
jgi:hypothetical protein